MTMFDENIPDFDQLYISKKKREWRKAHTANDDSDENTEYFSPYPPELRKEFWKSGLNPITGYPVPRPLHANQTELQSFHLPTMGKPKF